MRLSPPNRHRLSPPPVTPGLGADSVPFLTVEQIAARQQAAADREATHLRRSTARHLADRVAATPEPIAPAPAPMPAEAVAGSENSPRPWRDGPLVMRVPKKQPRTGPIVIPRRS
jgi:hypothetical protein